MAAVNNAVLQSLLEEAYKSVEKMIYELVNKHHRRFGGDYNEHLSTANEYFLRAAYSWDPSRGAFTTHVYNRIWYGFRTEAAYQHKKGGFVHDRMDEKEDRLDVEYIPQTHAFDLESFLKDLPPQARDVAQAALVLSKEDRTITRTKLVAVLKEAGWAAAEILHAFKEIGEALS